MIAASTALRQLLLSGQSHVRADLYTLSLIGGGVTRWTSFDQDVAVDGLLFSHAGPRITRGRGKIVLGLETDTLSMTFSVDDGHEPSLNGVPLRQAARSGLLDGAWITLEWAYFSGQPLVYVDRLTRFVGQAGGIDIDRADIMVTVNSPLKRLDMPVPSKTYGAACRWTLGDANCGVTLSSYAVAGSVLAGATNGQIPCTLTDAAGTWNGGKIVVTSGVDQVFRRTIRSSAPGLVSLSSPLPWAPAVGDGFVVTPGCDKSMGGSCVTRFNNLIRFGGMPFIPAPETAY